MFSRKKSSSSGVSIYLHKPHSNRYFLEGVTFCVKVVPCLKSLLKETEEKKHPFEKNHHFLVNHMSSEHTFVWDIQEIILPYLTRITIQATLFQTPINQPVSVDRWDSGFLFSSLVFT